jgi:hypothetical protein
MFRPFGNRRYFTICSRPLEIARSPLRQHPQMPQMRADEELSLVFPASCHV